MQPPQWDGFCSIDKDGKLWFSGWRNGIDIHELRALFWDAQQIGTLRRENQRLKAALDHARAAQDEAERRAAWYRGQLSTESRASLLWQVYR